MTRIEENRKILKNIEDNKILSNHFTDVNIEVSFFSQFENFIELYPNESFLEIFRDYVGPYFFNDDELNLIKEEMKPLFINGEEYFNHLYEEDILKPSLEESYKLKEKTWESINMPRKVIKYKKEWDKLVLDYVQKHTETYLTVIDGKICDAIHPFTCFYDKPKKFFQQSIYGKEICKEYNLPIEYEYDDKYNKGLE